MYAITHIVKETRQERESEGVRGMINKICKWGGGKQNKGGLYTIRGLGTLYRL